MTIRTREKKIENDARADEKMRGRRRRGNHWVQGLLTAPLNREGKRDPRLQGLSVGGPEKIVFSSNTTHHRKTETKSKR